MLVDRTDPSDIAARWRSTTQNSPAASGECSTGGSTRRTPSTTASASVSLALTVAA
jgi:hypothetical protein